MHATLQNSINCKMTHIFQQRWALWFNMSIYWFGIVVDVPHANKRRLYCITVLVVIFCIQVAVILISSPSGHFSMRYNECYDKSHLQFQFLYYNKLSYTARSLVNILHESWLQNIGHFIKVTFECLLIADNMSR